MEFKTKKSSVFQAVHKLRDYSGERPPQYSANVRVSKQDRIPPEEVIVEVLKYLETGVNLKELRLKAGLGPASIPNACEVEYNGTTFRFSPDQYQILQTFIEYPAPANDPRHKQMPEKTVNNIVANLKSKDNPTFEYVPSNQFKIMWRINNGEELVEVADTIDPGSMIVWNDKTEKTESGSHVTPFVFRSVPPDVDALRAVVAGCSVQYPKTKYDPRKDIHDFVYSCGMPSEYSDNFKAGQKSTCFEGVSNAAVVTMGRMLASGLATWKQHTVNEWFNEQNEPDFELIWQEISSKVYENPEQTPGAPYNCLTMKAAYELMTRGGCDEEATRAAVFETTDEKELKEKANRPITKNRQIYPLLLGEAYHILDVLINGGTLFDINNFGHSRPKDEMLTKTKDGKARAGRMYYVYNKAISSVITGLSRFANELSTVQAGHFSCYGLNSVTVNERTIGLNEYLKSIDVVESGRLKVALYGDDCINNNSGKRSFTDVRRNDYNINTKEPYVDAGYFAQTLRRDVADMSHSFSSFQLRSMLFYLSLCGYESMVARPTVFNAGLGTKKAVLFTYKGSHSGGPRTTQRNNNVNYSRRIYVSLIKKQVEWFTTDKSGLIIADAVKMKNFIFECLVKGIPWNQEMEDMLHTKVGITFKDELVGTVIKPGTRVTTNDQDFSEGFFIGGHIQWEDGQYVLQIRPERLICGLIHHGRSGQYTILAAYARAFSACLLFGTNRAYFDAVHPYCVSAALALPRRTPENVAAFADLMEMNIQGTMDIRNLVSVDEDARFEAPTYEFCYNLRTGKRAQITEVEVPRSAEMDELLLGLGLAQESDRIIAHTTLSEPPDATTSGTGSRWSEFEDMVDDPQALTQRYVPPVQTAKTEKLAENIGKSKKAKREKKKKEAEEKIAEELKQKEEAEKKKAEEALMLLRAEKDEKDREVSERLEAERKARNAELAEVKVLSVVPEEKEKYRKTKSEKTMLFTATKYLDAIKPVPTSDVTPDLMRKHPQYGRLLAFSKEFKRQRILWTQSENTQAEKDSAYAIIDQYGELIKAVALCSTENTTTGINPTNIPKNIKLQSYYVNRPALEVKGTFDAEKVNADYETLWLPLEKLIEELYLAILPIHELYKILPYLKPFVPPSLLGGEEVDDL